MANQPGGFPPPTGLPVIAGQGPAPAARRPLWGRILLWGGIALMVIGVVGAVGDWASRTWEMNQLLSRIEGSEQAMQIAKDSIGAVTLPPDATQQQKDAATRQLETASAEGADEVAAAGDEVAEVRFLPWHSELIQAQSAYLSHNAAWADYLDRGASEPLTLFGEDNRIEPTWAAAEAAIRSGVPIPALPMITTRVDEIFSDDEPAPDTDDGGVPA